MSAPRPFAVDLDDLEDAIEVLTCGESTFDDALDVVRRRVAELHDDFDGLSAQAHLAAQQEWETGYARMRGALADLRGAARTARDNYQGAAEANVAAWAGGP